MKNTIEIAITPNCFNFNALTRDGSQETDIRKTSLQKFSADCDGWDARRFATGASFMVSMPADKWASWLKP
jgi:hypothetical protein